MLLSIIVTSILHIFSGLSMEHSNFVLAALCIIVTSVPLNNTTNPLRLHNLTSDWPMDIRAVLTLLNIDPELCQYICCPTCCSLYGPFLEQPSDYHGVPDSCSHCATPTSPPCGALLFQESKKQGVCIPSCRFSYQPLRSWLARFLSRADVMASLRQTVDIECLCTLVVLMETFLVITSAPSFHGSSHDLWLVFSFVSPCLLCLCSWNFHAQSLFSSVSDTGHKVCNL